MFVDTCRWSIRWLPVSLGYRVICIGNNTILQKSPRLCLVGTKMEEKKMKTERNNFPFPPLSLGCSRGKDISKLYMGGFVSAFFSLTISAAIKQQAATCGFLFLYSAFPQTKDSLSRRWESYRVEYIYLQHGTWLLPEEVALRKFLQNPGYEHRSDEQASVTIDSKMFCSVYKKHVTATRW